MRLLCRPPIIRQRVFCLLGSDLRLLMRTIHSSSDLFGRSGQSGLSGCDGLLLQLSRLARSLLGRLLGSASTHTSARVRIGRVRLVITR